MDRRLNRFNSKKISISGIMLAITVLCLFLATVLPTNRLSFYALSSFTVSVIIIEYGAKAGWAFYIASCLLSFVLVYEKLELIPYILFFGLYGIAKYYIEKLNNILLEYVLKYTFFNICIMLFVLFVREIILKGIEIKFPWWIFAIVLQIVFLIYDYVYTLFIQYYKNRLRMRFRI